MLNLSRDLVLAARPLSALGLSWRGRQPDQADARRPALVHHDALKEILARARFICDLDEAAALGQTVAVHCLDVDRFRDINAAMGTEVGDAVLEHVAQELSLVGGDGDLRARIGGDEFALAQAIANPREVTRTALEILSALSMTIRLGGQEVDVSVCVGSAVAPAHGQDAAALLENAEVALVHAKGKGRARRALFRPEMNRVRHESGRVETILRAAATKERFDLAYRPIRRAPGGGLAGFEAALRLPDPEGGYLPPAVFLPLAERLGLMAPIGEAIIRHACAAAATWPSQLFIAVNLAPAQVEDKRLAAIVGQALDAAGLAAGRLELEIAESLFLLHADVLPRQLRELKSLGVKIVLDDFGAGYSSLPHLSQFPFDKLKTDQAFSSLSRDGEGAGGGQPGSVIAAIVALGRSLGMIVAADGVTSAAQAAYLSGLGVDLLQGSAIGRPVEPGRVGDAILEDCRPERHATRAPEIVLERQSV